MSEATYTLGKPNHKTKTIGIEVRHEGKTYTRIINGVYGEATKRSTSGYNSEKTKERAEEIFSAMVNKIEVGAIAPDT